ncbi:MAG: single-stranded-DNA-specific exonuclease RecJ [Candidatus Limnocylindrales bacterium]
MLEPHYRWIFPSPVEIAPDVVDEAARLGISRRTAEVLARRGVADGAALRAFFAPPAAALNDPASLPDADLMRERVARARRDGEGILVFGDFDADGLSGLATLTLALRFLGLRVEPYVPSRLEEGHGLSLLAVDVAAELGLSVIVTVDCGSTSGPEIGAAAARGIDVLVTDHHRLPPVLPAAVAVVNPHRVDSRYPDDRLSGSGVAFVVARLLLADEPGGPEFALTLAESAVIGTVSDIAPILGENRAIARLGLERMRTAPRPGIAALLARAGIARGDVDLETVAFSLAPRLNAAGRVGDPLDAARLLLTEDPDEAAALAEGLESTNLVRRELTAVAVDEARRAVGTLPEGPLVMVRGPWPVGVIGLVAARLAEEHGRPAIVGAELGHVVRASCRTSGEFDLAAALESSTDLLLQHGGHAGAAGFEVEATRWDELAARLRGLAVDAGTTVVGPELRLDLALPAGDVDYPLLRELASLEPTGNGNPAPLVGVLGTTVSRVRAAKGGHTQLTLRRERDVVDAIAFDRADLTDTVAEGDRIDVVATLASRTFGGFESLQLEILDVATSGSHDEAAEILGLALAGAAR